MKWTDKDIDKLFKDKAENVSFAYKNDYWKEMEAMIPAKKKGGDAFWLLTSFLLIGLLAITPFMEEDAQMAQRNSNKELLAEQMNAGLPNATVAKKEATAKKNPTNLDANSNVAENQESKSSSTEKLPNNTKKNSFNKDVQTVSPANHSAAYKEGSKSLQTFEAKNDVVSQQTENGVINDVENSSENSTLPSSVKKSNLANETMSINASKNNENSDLISQNQLVVSSIEHQVGSLPFNNLQTMEKSMHSELAEFNGIAQDLKMPSRVAFYGQALGGASQSMVIPSNQFSYNMGLGFGVQINKGKLEFLAGLNGVWSIHDDIVLSRQAKVYSFGSDVINYELKYKEIFSLEANLSLGYKLGNSTLSLGLRPSYNAGSKISYRTNDLNGTETVENFYGFSEGIHRFGLKPMLGYSYNFRRGLSIGLNVGMQLFPLVDESFVQGINSKLPIDGQIYLRKQINFRK